MAAVVEIASQMDLQNLCTGHSGITVVMLWTPSFEPSVHMTKVLEGLAVQQPDMRYAKVNIDICPMLQGVLGATETPFVAFLDQKGTKVAEFAGADPPNLLMMVKTLAEQFKAAGCASGGAACVGTMDKPAAADAAAKEELHNRLKELIDSAPVMLFMKGSKTQPFCKFSKQVIAIFGKHPGVDYSTFNILEDEAVRQGLKDYSNWPTFPQLYVKGELMGGIDIIKEMDEEGSLGDTLSPGSA